MSTVKAKLCYTDIGHDPGPVVLFWMSNDGGQYENVSSVNPDRGDGTTDWNRIPNHSSLEEEKEYGFYSDDCLHAGLRGRIDDLKQMISVVSYDGTLTQEQEKCLRYWTDRPGYKIMVFG